MIKALVRYAAFPGTLAAFLALGLVAIETLGDPIPTLIGLSFASLVVVTGLERLCPYRPEWNRSHGDLRTDVVHFLVTSIPLAELIRIAAFGSVVGINAWLCRQAGGSLWPSSWPIVTQLVFGFVVADLPQYWVHRLLHSRPWLWRFHAVHHSSRRLYWVNATRFHPIDAVLIHGSQLVSLALLGCPTDVLGLVMLVTTVVSAFQHGNVDTRIGPLAWVIAAGDVHRYHHARTPTRANCNFGAIVSIWDRAFGTFYLPVKRRVVTDVALEEMPGFPNGYFAQLAAPFRWKRMRREAAQAPSRRS